MYAALAAACNPKELEMGQIPKLPKRCHISIFYDKKFQKAVDQPSLMLLLCQKIHYFNALNNSLSTASSHSVVMPGTDFITDIC